MAHDDFAVVVGIDGYRSLRDLAGAENDASDFDAWLRKPAGGDVPGDHVAKLLGSELGPGTNPRVDEIDDEFSKLQSGLETVENEGRTGRRLYIFLAGHGFDPEGDDAALLCATAAPRRLGDHISGRLYSLWFKKAALFHEIVLIMDCCRDDYTRIPMRSPPWAEENRTGTNTKMFKGLATRWSFQSRERPDPLSQGRVRGFYSRVLLDILDAGKVTGEELKKYTMNGLTDLVSGELQEPEIHTDPGLVFSEAADKPTGTLSVTASPGRVSHTFRLNDPDGAPIESHVMTTEPWIHEDRTFGMYAITDEATGELRYPALVSRRVNVTF